MGDRRVTGPISLPCRSAGPLVRHCPATPAKRRSLARAHARAYVRGVWDPPFQGGPNTPTSAVPASTTPNTEAGRRRSQVRRAERSRQTTAPRQAVAPPTPALARRRSGTSVGVGARLGGTSRAARPATESEQVLGQRSAIVTGTEHGLVLTGEGAEIEWHVAVIVRAILILCKRGGISVARADVTRDLQVGAE